MEVSAAEKARVGAYWRKTTRGTLGRLYWGAASGGFWRAGAVAYAPKFQKYFMSTDEIISFMKGEMRSRLL